MVQTIAPTIPTKAEDLWVLVNGIAQLLPMQSWALGLADIEVQSALNERFNAKIELLDSQGFQPTEIVVKMASREDL